MQLKTIGIFVGIAVVVAALGMWLLFGPIANAVGGSLQGLNPKEQVEAKNSIRQTLVQAAGGVALVGTLAFSGVAAVQSFATLEAQRDAQVTDRYTKAVDQLGSNEPSVRAAAIYALERISKDSSKDHNTVIQVISTFARSSSPRPTLREKEGRLQKSDRPSADIDAAMIVLGHRNMRVEKSRLRLDGIYLPNANLRRLRLPGTLLHESNLSGMNAGGTETDIRNIDLSGAMVICADLSWADISSYNPREGSPADRTNMQFVTLTGSRLIHANLQGALMGGAKLEYAHLEGADLRYAKGLKVEQLEKTYIDEKTKLPEGLGKVKSYTGKEYPCWK
ncbi:pentapeptide repeat-containing protein [Streptomyces sp. NPDC048723]|uniref:pentapeptide repeat-containing protein n=1 Tax=Streptomyces sp. NPDC048723 TaxID=3365589 RepID=UPI0037180B66